MPEQRIQSCFDRLKAEGKTALVTYLMAGDPDLETSYQAMCTLRDKGADIIELGMPFTDPMADGPAIQKAALRALAQNTRLQDVLDLVRRFRAADQETPIILMGYANPVHCMGYAEFTEAAAEAGIDGTILVDLPPEEDAPIRAAYAPHQLSVIRLATPTTDAARMQTIAEGASGFIYYVAVAGVTGAGAARPEDIQQGVDTARRLSGLPVCVGFGIRTPEQAVQMSEIAEGIVVGSALVDQARLASEAGTPHLAAQKMGELAQNLSQALQAEK